nr:TPA_asm: hypothetical protein [Opistofel virus]
MGRLLHLEGRLLPSRPGKLIPPPADPPTIIVLEAFASTARSLSAAMSYGLKGLTISSDPPLNYIKVNQSGSNEIVTVDLELLVTVGFYTRFDVSILTNLIAYNPTAKCTPVLPTTVQAEVTPTTLRLDNQVVLKPQVSAQDVYQVVHSFSADGIVEPSDRLEIYLRLADFSFVVKPPLAFVASYIANTTVRITAWGPRVPPL